MKTKIIKLDEVSVAGNYYSTEVMQKAIDALEGKDVLGTVGINPSTSINVAEVSHIVRNLAIEDGWLVGDIVVLKTPKGAILEALPEDAYQFAPCGTGIKDEEGKVSDFNLLSIYASPSGKYEVPAGQ